ncbi:hypothetical protein M5K25_010684 [Dendrobium thyrsiflorum]|uniref:GDSL esterase/lipase n=1 Tax=Dendrobium thyrsiflorum TaxID=117978 RepID=A0ABD0V1A8_DENTH
MAVPRALAAVTLYLFISVSAAVASASASASAVDFNYPAIFNFGDSNSDTGELVAGIGDILDPPYGQTYFQRPAGRFCDGRLIIDFLSDFFLLRFTPLFSKGIEMGDHSSSKNPLEDRPAYRSESSKKIHKKPKTDDAISTITEDSFISFRKNFHFQNDLVMKVPARSDRARFPPPRYVTVYEFSLRAGLQLPLAPELIDILTICRLEQHMDFKLEMTKTLNDWNTEFVKMDRLHIELVDAQTTINQQMKDQQILEDENKRLQSILSEKEAQQLPSTVIEQFKKSFAFKIIIEDHIQEARNHIYDVEVKTLEAECMEDDFIKGFMKSVCAVYRKTGADIQGLSPSQAFGDHPLDSGGEEVESELQKAFSVKEDEDDIEIL